MLPLILFLSIALIFIMIIILLSIIKSKLARILTISIFLIIHISLISLLLFVISGEDNIIDGFDKLSNIIMSNEKLNEDEIDEQEAEDKLDDFLKAWQQQDIQSLSTMVTNAASYKLYTELPLSENPKIIAYDIFRLDEFDLETGMITAMVEVEIQHSDETSEEIVFSYSLIHQFNDWYILDGERKDNYPNLFRFIDIQKIIDNSPTPAITPTTPPVPTATLAPTLSPAPTAISTLPPNNTGKTYDDMLAYFIEVALDNDEGVIIRWEQPIQVEIKGDYTTKDYDRIIDQLDILNDLDTLPPISVVETGGNFIMHFTPQNNIKNVAPECDGIYDWYIYYEDNVYNQFSEVICAIASDTNNQTQRNYAILGAIAHGLGLLGDSSTYKDSISHPEWTDIQLYSDIDYYMMQLLYNGRITSGMGKQEAIENLS